jgi:hypothetical protein
MVENQNMMIYYISLPPHNLCVVAAVLYLRRDEKIHYSIYGRRRKL